MYVHIVESNFICNVSLSGPVSQSYNKCNVSFCNAGTMYVYIYVYRHRIHFKLKFTLIH